MAVVDGVTLVSTVSLQVLQDDPYSPLLEVTRRLHGEMDRYLYLTYKYIHYRALIIL